MAVTGTTMEQLPDAGMVPPDRATEEPPLSIVTVPPQVLEVGAAAVFCMLVDGYVSVKAAPVIGMALELISLMVMFEAPDTGMAAGLKLFVAVGEATTRSVSEAAMPAPALPVAIFPVLFKYEPAAVPVTFTVITQLPDAGMVPPERLNELPPVVFVTVPPQVLL